MLDAAVARLTAAEPRRRPRLMNHLDDLLTPREYVALGEQLTDPELAALYARRSVTLAMTGQEPRSFERRQVAPNVQLFSDPAHAAGSKTLLIGFAGRFGRLMIPNVGFVQCLPAESFDVLLMADPRARHFRDGLPGYGTSFRSLVDAIEADFPARDYRRRVAIGASMGGLPAVWCGLMAGTNRTPGTSTACSRARDRVMPTIRSAPAAAGAIARSPSSLPRITRSTASRPDISPDCWAPRPWRFQA
jgi:hypothetical protein